MRSAVVPAAVALLHAAAGVAAGELRTTQVVDGVYMITGAGGNVTVSAAESGIMVVDSGRSESSTALLAAIRAISNGPIRYVINTSVAADHIGGNETLRRAGATFTGGNATVVAGVDEGAAIVAHESALLRLADNVPVAAQPTETFFVPKVDFYFNDQPVEIRYQPAAVDDTNVIVHFRRADVIVTGDVFRLDTYPHIDLANGGSVDGVLDALNGIIDLAVSKVLAEGGTMIVPGHGRVCDEADVVRYRDMVTIIRDRVKALVDRGQSLEEVKRARPSLDYDSRYGGAGTEWTTDDFIEAVYSSMKT
jgi:glyoxylase-like metal-dependent hydrolase (beta-lactamase superfamily II)